MRTRPRICLASFIAALCVLLPAGGAMGLDLAVPTVHANFLWGKGYTGSGLELGVLDMYLADNSHPALGGNFAGHVKFAKAAAFLGSHATQVAGAAVGNDATYSGVAPGASWWSGQTVNPAGITKVQTQTVAAETFARGLDALAGDPVEVITLSIGLGGSTDGLDQWSLALDHVVATNGAIVTVAAGNDGPGSGTLSGLPTAAYNAIIVGATGGSDGAASEDYEQMAYYSSRGSTADGRSKPDLVAPGSIIYMPTLSGGWSDASGTSFATPIVAGGALLLRDMGGALAHSTDPKVVKSVLMNSADKLAGWSHTATDPLDAAQGAGQMNLCGAWRQYVPAAKAPGSVEGIGWDLQTVATGGENLYALDVDLPTGAVITATLIWDRHVATDTEDIDRAEYSVDHLDDLNLRLYAAADLAVPVDQSVSTVDNAEHIVFKVTDAGRYVLGVNLLTAAASEQYALAWHVGPAAGLDAPGDTDLDGDVDLTDLLAIRNYFGKEATWFDGDMDSSAEVDLGDLLLVRNHFGTAASPVPEPTGLAILLAAAAPLAKRCRQRGFRHAVN